MNDKERIQLPSDPFVIKFDTPKKPGLSVNIFMLLLEMCFLMKTHVFRNYKKVYNFAKPQNTNIKDSS